MCLYICSILNAQYYLGVATSGDIVAGSSDAIMWVLIEIVVFYATVGSTMMFIIIESIKGTRHPNRIKESIRKRVDILVY